MIIKRKIQMVSFAVAVLPSCVFAASCEELTELAMPDTTITLAESVAAGALPGSPNSPSYTDLPAFCRVQATIAPSADSAIKIEVWFRLQTGWQISGRGNGVVGS